ncbi:myeloid cell surface antigen CD33-like [Rhynchocyon petersi]
MPLLLVLLSWLWAGSLAQNEGFHLFLNDKVTVQEGLCVLVPCSVFYPNKDWKPSTPAYGYWFRNGTDYREGAPVATNDQDRRVQRETRGRFHLVEDPRNRKCSLDITDARMADTGSYFFRVVRGTFVKFNYLENWLFVHVTALTKTPNIRIQKTLESGFRQNIMCMVPWACRRGTLPTYSWTGDAVTSLDPRARHSSVLSLIPEPRHHGTNLTCRVTLPGAGVTTENTVRLSVSCERWAGGPGSLRAVGVGGDRPQNLTVSVFWRNGSGRHAPRRRVKFFNKKSTKTTKDDIHPVLDTSSQGHLYESLSDCPLNHPKSAATVPTPSDELDLHYACVTFEKASHWNSQEREATIATDYSEIKIQK